MSNRKKDEQLGMSHGAASNKLRKKILFDFVKMAGQDICYRCGKKIENIDSFSIEHKEPWLDSEDPVGLYFDLGNIAFSHLSCNCRASKRGGPKPFRLRDDGSVYCPMCKKWLDPSLFLKRNRPGKKSAQYQAYCKQCKLVKNNTRNNSK